ncbi:MAG: hypothetical protein HZB42_10280 [Sphingobacteriales bacterium]|nr:hypothetical protein [Sphingobacteriales bacterium]
MKKKISIGVCLIFTAISLSAQNLVPNPQFELARPSSPDYVYQNPQMEKYQKGCLENLFRYTQCQNWTMWLGSTTNEAGVMTETVKAATNCVPPWPNYVMGNMMHVKTTLGGSGIVNSDIPAGTGKVKISCWVYVIKGKVNMGYGPTGSAVVSTMSRYTCRWEKLEMVKSGAEACNQITLYSSNTADVEFYVDAVSVVKI